MVGQSHSFKLNRDHLEINMNLTNKSVSFRVLMELFGLKAQVVQHVGQMLPKEYIASLLSKWLA